MPERHCSGTMLKYSVLIICAVHGPGPAYEFDAATDNEAVDLARAHHRDPESKVVLDTVPDEGGDYEIAVNCLESVVLPAPGGGTWTRPAGAEVSRFTCTHEPAPHVAEAVYAQRAADDAAKAAAEKREETRAKLLDELKAEHPELAAILAAKGEVK